MADYRNIIDLFEHVLATANPIDKDLYENIKKFRISWAQKNEDHIDFLGGTLLGANPIRFSSLDENIFFKDVLNVNESAIAEGIRETKGIDYKRKVESNPLYATVLYLAHVYTNKNIGSKIQEDAVVELYNVFAYKTISSLVSHYFKYEADISLLKATEMRLSGKFLIKQVDSWQELFNYRARDLLKGGIHYQRIKRFTTDDYLRIVVDLQTRIRSIVKNIYSVMMDVKEDNEKVVSSNNLVENEDGITLGDITSGDDVYTKELNRLLISEQDLIDNDLLYLLNSTVTNFNVNHVIDGLKFLVNTDIKEKPMITEAIMLNGLDILRRRKIDNYNKNVLEVIKLMKSNFSHHKQSDTFKKARDILKDNLRKGMKISNTRATYLTLNLMIYLFVKAAISLKK